MWQDTVRLAATGPGPRVTARLAAGCGRDGADLDRAVRAWEYGGRDALAVLDERWTPDAEALACAGVQLARAWEGEARRPRLRADGNRWTAHDGRAQLRYGRDGRWWPYREEGGHWYPAGPAATDPATALAGARRCTGAATSGVPSRVRPVTNAPRSGAVRGRRRRPRDGRGRPRVGAPPRGVPPADDPRPVCNSDGGLA